MRRTSGQRAGLSRDQVLRAAHAIVVEHGAGALSMRALAARLGVAPNALYAWVATKAALLDALVDDAVRDVRPPPDACPRAGVRGLLVAAYDAMTACPDLAPLFIDRRHSPGPNAARIRGDLGRLLGEAGVGADLLEAAVPVLLVHTIGFAAVVQHTGGNDLLGPPDSARQAFERGLDWILDGLRADP